MNFKLVCFILSLLFFADYAAAQSCPPNIDFEDGDFSNWQCFTGNATVSGGKNVMVLNPTAPTVGRHEIITATSTPKKDPYGNFPTFCPYGGKYSVKLGNDNSGGEAEGVSYTFIVPTTVDTFTFTYFYAVVFQNPGHALEQQPRFFVTAYDVASGEVINCASYDYVSSGSLPGFQISRADPGVLYRSWSPTSLQFAGLGGRAVRLEFKTADCTLGAHFGYAYLDVGSACSNILATAPYCRETNSLLLNAPYGFKTYIWYNDDFSKVVGNQQSITLSPPPATAGVFKVDVIPYPGYGCRDTFNAAVTPLPTPAIPLVENIVYCQNTFAPKLEASDPEPGNDILWYVNDTLSMGTEIAPMPFTTTPGIYTYYASQKTLFGCESFRKRLEVNIVPMPVVSFTCNATRQCERDNRFLFTNTTTNKSKSIFYWDFGDGSQLTTDMDTVISYHYTKNGYFNVSLKVENAGTCTLQNTTGVTVVPKPIAMFSYPPIICEKQTSINVTDQSSVPGGVASITKWWWNFNGTILSVKNPSSFIPNTPGSIQIKLVTATGEGCLSDTASVVLPVYYKPVAAMRYSALLCDNEVIQFLDASTLPAAASGETVVKWDWRFAGSGSSLQNPTMTLAAGSYHSQLVAETNFGCKSNRMDTVFSVYPKPEVALNINDSCVFRSIKYQAVDLQNSVSDWYWDFGTSLKKGNALTIKSYTTAGYRPLTLIGQTVHGCKDTIDRPFAIYDNKAFAGRDTITAMDEPVQLNARGGSNNAYVWSPATGLNNAAIENPVAILNYDQTYHLDAITKEGCDAHGNIKIKRYKGPTIYMPTAFTPNNDGHNDLFTVLPVGIKQFHYLEIYTRAGELIFRTTDHTKGWDGTFKGESLSTATFVVIAEAIDYKGRTMFKKATVTLIR